MVNLSQLLIAVVFGSGLISLAAGALAHVRTRERRDHAGTAFAVTMFVLALWAALLGFQLVAGPTRLAYFLVQAKGIVATPVATTALLFTLYYTGHGEWVTTPRVAALSLEPAAAAALAVFNPDYLFFSTVVERTAYGVPVIVADPGTGFILHLAYGFLVGAAAVMLLTEAAFRSSGPYRNQAMTLALVGFAYLMGQLLFVLNPPWMPPFDFTPVLFSGGSLLLLFAMVRFDLFDVAPVAHETVFSTLDDAIVVVDESSRVLEVNPAARDAFDLRRDVVGLDAKEVLPDSEQVEALLDGDDVEMTLDGNATEFSVGPAPEPTYFEATCEELDRDGVRLLVFSDITERTEVERRYRSYVEHAEDIIAVADVDGVIQYISPAVESVLGYEPQEVEGEVFTDYVHPDDRRSVAEPLADSLEHPGESLRVTFRAEHRDGGWRTLDGVGVNQFHDPHIAGYLLTLRNETPRDRYEQRLRVLTRVLRHDLRNELNVVLGYADVIAATGSEETGEYAESIHRSAERLASLGERVRDVDQTLQSTDHGGRPVDVAAVAEEVAERARERFPAVELTTDTEGAFAYADELLTTAVWNAVENAVRHHDGQTPRVALSTQCDGNSIELRVADDGPGIPDEDRLAVESGHETQLQHASGIGLWLVRWIVDGVDGELTFVDDPDGDVGPAAFDDVGTVVVLRLRAAEGDHEAADVADQIEPWDTPTPGTERIDGRTADRQPRRNPNVGAPPRTESDN